MKKEQILDKIGRGRTDLVFELLRLPDWQETLRQGQVRVLQWFIYYNDVTALKAVLEAGGDLSSVALDEELGNAAFFGHWKVCDFNRHSSRRQLTPRIARDSMEWEERSPAPSISRRLLLAASSQSATNECQGHTLELKGGGRNSCAPTNGAHSSVG